MDPELGAARVVRNGNSPLRISARRHRHRRRAPPSLVHLARCPGDLLGNVRIQFSSLFLRNALFPSSYPGIAWVPGAPLTDNLRVVAQTVLLFYVMPLLYVGAIGLALWGRGDALLRSGLVLSAWVGAAFYMSVWGRPDVWHVAFATAGFFLFTAVAFVVLLDAATPRVARWVGLLSVGAVAVATLWTGSSALSAPAASGRESPFLPPGTLATGHLLASRRSDVWPALGFRVTKPPTWRRLSTASRPARRRTTRSSI